MTSETMPQMTSPQQPRVLVTGATGYIGSRLVPVLLAAGHRVRVLTRSADRLRARNWAGDVEVVEGDATSPATVNRDSRDVFVPLYCVASFS